MMMNGIFIKSTIFSRMTLRWNFLVSTYFFFFIAVILGMIVEVSFVDLLHIFWLLLHEDSCSGEGLKDLIVVNGLKKIFISLLRLLLS